MAKIPLRAYINEIETIIEQQQTEEAIAHCRHILLMYPKHIETYRMLGKAYLEGRHYTNAVDIFKRVLSAIPYDFVSHVGMSIAREDDGNLNAAIWHMERAFEGQPYNAAIQGELRRLYGKRDGMAPPKIHLTRGALARMYTKGNLYQQAIAELRAAIAEDPQRLDLQTFLAQVYFQHGETAKAIESCGTVLKKLPYSLDANLMLVQLLETSNRSEEAEVYKKRVQELDPYQAYINPKVPNKDQVQDQAVLVEQLIWDGGPAVETADQPEWATSVGVTLEVSRSVKDELPDWMDDTSEEVPKLPSRLDDDDAGSEDQMIPDFMKDAGWGPSTGTFDESKSVFDVDEEDSPLEASEAIEGEIPDWLQQIAPPEATDSIDAAAEIPEGFPSQMGEDVGLKPQDIELSAWLQDTEEGEDDPTGITGTAETADIFGKEDTEEEIPDWLSEIDAEQAPDTEIDEIPDWLQGSEEESKLAGEPVPDEGEDAELPDWLSQAAVGAAGIAGTVAVADILSDDEDETSPAIAGSQPKDAKDVELPERLLGVSEEREEPKPLDEEEASLAEEAKIPVWLQDVAEDKESEPLLEEISAPVDEAEFPDWLQDVAEEQEAPKLLEDAEATLAEEVEIPVGLQDVAEDKEPEPTVEEISAPIDEAESPDSADEAESSTKTVSGEVDDVELPDWAVPAAVGAASVAGGAVAAEIFSDENDEESEVTASLTPKDATETELANLQEYQTSEQAGFEPLADEPLPAEEAEIPDWLQDVIEDKEPEPVAEEESAPVDEAEIPDWLQGVAEEQEEPKPLDEREATLAEEVEIPDWLQDVAEGREPEPIVEEISAPVDEAESPEWLQDVAEEQEAPKLLEDAEATLAEVTDVPDWLQEVLEDQETEAIDMDESAQVDESDIPEWFQDVAEDDKTEFVDELESPPVGEVEAPDSPDEAESSTKTVTGEVDDAELPDWAVPAAAGAASIAGGAVAAEIFSDENDEESEVTATLAPKDATETELANLQEYQTSEQAGFEPLADEPLPAEEAEIPDWLQDVIEDKEPEPVAEEESAPVDEAEIPDWLQGVPEEQEEPKPLDDEEPIFTEDVEIPDWLQDVAEDREPELIVEEISAPVDEAESPEWLQDVAEEQEAPKPLDDEEPIFTEDVEIPDWLQDVVEDKEPETSVVEESTPVDEAEMPDWLQNVTEEQAEDKPLKDEETTLAEEVEIPDWLQDVVEDKEPEISVEGDLAPEVELISEEEKIPDWIQEVEAAEETPVPISEKDDNISDLKKASIIVGATLAGIGSITEDETPLQQDEPDEPPVVQTPENLIPSFDLDDPDAAMAWLESLAAKKGVSEDELLTSPEERDEVLSKWVQEEVDDGTESPEPKIEEAVGLNIVEEITEVDSIDWIPEPDQQSMGTEEKQSISEELPGWLEDIPEEPDKTEEQTLELDEIPEWLQDISEDVPTIAGEAEVEQKEPIDNELDDIPDWIQDIVEEEVILKEDTSVEVPEIVVEEESAPVDEEESPDWLQAVSEDIVPEITDAPKDDLDDAENGLTWLEDLVEQSEDTDDDKKTYLEDFRESSSDQGQIETDWIQDADAKETDTALGQIPKELDETPKVDGQFETDQVSEISEGKLDPSLDSPEFLQDAITTSAITSDISPIEQQESEEFAIEPEPPTAKPTEGIEHDFDDADSAMAWLESLAAEQRVSEDQLLTSPEESPGTPPEWVQIAIDTASSKEQPIPTIDTESEKVGDSDWFDDASESKEPITDFVVPTEPSPEAPEIESADLTETKPGEEVAPDFEDVDAAMAWLESLAVKQGVSEEELLTRPEDRSETPPDWVLDSVEGEESSTTADAEVKPEVAETQELATTQTMSVETAAPEGGEDISFAPPSWIADGQVPEDEDLSWLPTDDSNDESQFLDLNLASLIQLERLPGIGFRRAQSITAYREEHGDFQSMDDLLSVPGMDHDTLELLKTRVAIMTPEQTQDLDAFPQGELFDPQDIEPDDAIHEMQLDAQTKLNDGKVEEAIDGYSEIIEKGQRLNDVIDDLNKAADKFPEDMSIVQTLGDAYLRANKLQEALEAYTKAENLLH